MTTAGDSAESSKTQLDFFQRAATKVRSKFPSAPGVYLFQDQAGRVIYIGKAKDLRARVVTYFLQAAAQDRRTAQLVREAYDVDFIEAESEVDALLMEARLIKDTQPKFNRELRDDKSFPYLQITTHEEFPRVEITREPRAGGVKLYGPFANVGSLRGALQVLQRVFKFRTCSLDIEADDDRWRWFRPCLLASIQQCTAPCNLRISKEEYRRDIKRLRMFLDGKRQSLLKEMRAEMSQAAADLRFEKAARLRDEVKMLESLRERGDLEKHEQPEVFYVDPKKGLSGLQKLFALDNQPRTIEGVDIAHLGGNETVASLVQFIDGLPFKQVTGAIAFERLTVWTIMPAFARSLPADSNGSKRRMQSFQIFFSSTVARANLVKGLKHSRPSESNPHWCCRSLKKRSLSMACTGLNRTV